MGLRNGVRRFLLGEGDTIVDCSKLFLLPRPPSRLLAQELSLPLQAWNS